MSKTTGGSRLFTQVRWSLLSCMLLAMAPAAITQAPCQASDETPYSEQIEPPKDSARQLVKDIALDQKQIWMRHGDHENAIGAGGSVWVKSGGHRRMVILYSDSFLAVKKC